MRTTKAKLALIAAAPLLAVASPAEPTTGSLAHFASGEQALSSLIEFPRVRGDVDEIIYCQAEIGKTGEIARNHCFAERNKKKFTDEIYRAARHAAAVPAVVASEVYEVRLHYRVAFLRKDGVWSIRVFENWGLDTDRYGEEYRAPQIYSSVSYPKSCIQTYLGSIFSTGRFYGIAANSVDLSGTSIGDVAVKSTGPFNPSPDCIADIKKTHADAAYIPARADGRAVAAHYIEPWGGYGALVID